jgi:hypothetical protein
MPVGPNEQDLNLNKPPQPTAGHRGRKPGQISPCSAVATFFRSISWCALHKMTTIKRFKVRKLNPVPQLFLDWLANHKRQ